jgi:hypothetical protein
MGVALTENDMATRPRTLRTTTGNDIAGGPCIIWGIGVTSGAVDDGRILLHNDDDGTSNTMLFRAPVSDSRQRRFEPTGIRFDTNLSITALGGDNAPSSFFVLYTVE